MGVPLNLKDIQSGFLTASAFNSNNTLIEQALDKALDRTGASDNAMEVDLDMGLFNINNVAPAFLTHQAVNFGQAQNILSASSDQVTSTTDIESFTATEGQTVFNFSSIEYIQNVNALLVFVNGIYQVSGTEYTETSTTSITFASGLTAGDIVIVLGARFNAEVFVTQSQANADDAEAAATEAENWANYPEDSLVPEGDQVDDYSALHWANKAEDSAATAQTAAGYKLGINNQAGTSYTLVASDEGDLVRMTSASANTVTVPTNAAVAFEIGTIVNVRQAGAGTTTISPDSGVTVNAPNNEFTTDGEEFGVALVKVATDEWDLVKSYAGVRNDQFDSDITASKGASGYQKLPSGLIMQWGQASAAYNGSSSVTFPLAFPSACINVTLGQEDTYTSGINETSGTVGGITSTGFTVYNRLSGDGGGGEQDTVPYFWFALGA